MIADLKRSVLLYPHLYQAKQQAWFFLLFVLIGWINIRSNYDGADLMLPVFLWSFYALMPSSVLLRMDYAAYAGVSPYRKRLLTAIPVVLLYVAQILMWCLVVFAAHVTGRSADLCGFNAVVLLALHFVSVLLGSIVNAISAKFHRIVSTIVMMVIMILIITFALSQTGSPGSEILSGASWLFAGTSRITPAVTIAIVALLGIINAAVFYLMLRVMYKYPVRREYLERLKG
ncbi:MAG: hypothetical protein IJQ12_08980 [Lachnospiraceae bacterium]|nr:hypothetical protein [Lachnospiraceae bacterium]